MPAPSDDDMFKRMFAQFVSRKKSGGARSSAPSSANHHARGGYLDTAPPDALRKVATEFTGRTFVGERSPPPSTNPLRLGSHHNSSRKHGRHSDSKSGLASLFQLRNSREVPSTAPPHRSKHAQKNSRGSKGSKSSKGSKGSEKQVSASTEDAPPRKRTRTHNVRPANSLARSYSAHAGTLHNVRPGKSEKTRNVSRFNLPPAQPPPPSTAPPSRTRASPSSRPSASKSFPCDKCNAVFAQKGQLSRHIRRVHEKLRPHACEFCGRLFGARSDRSRHVMIVHEKVRKFPCQRCGFQFQAKTHLEAHIRTVHDGERPYRCEQCGFSFGLRSNLLTHERAVHYREAKWSCKICDTAFNRKHDMFRHMKLMHDAESGQSASASRKH